MKRLLMLLTILIFTGCASLDVPTGAVLCIATDTIHIENGQVIDYDGDCTDSITITTPHLTGAP